MTISFFQYFEFLAFILSVVFYTDLKKHNLGTFMLFMLISCATEVAGRLMMRTFHFKNNYTLFDCYEIYTTSMLSYIFYRILDYKGVVKILFLAGCSVSVLLIILNFIFLQGYHVYDTYSAVIMQIVSVLLSISLIIKIFTEETIEVKLTDNPFFWISSGLIVYSLVAIVMLGLQQYIAAKNINLFGQHIYRPVIQTACVILYSCYGYAFVLCRKLTKNGIFINAPTAVTN